MSAKGVKTQRPLQRELLSPTENATPALPGTHGLELSLYFRNLCASLCNISDINIHLYIF